MRAIRHSRLWFGVGALLMLACTWMAQAGAPVALRHIGIPAVLIAASLLFAPRLAGLPRAAVAAAPGLPALMLFMLLVGAGGMVNHGQEFAAMTGDFWHADLLVAPDRRPVLPAIAWLLPPWPAPYAAVWYAAFASMFLAAWHCLGRQGLTPPDRFAVLTGSIVAYLLIIPGYTEVLTFLVALLCWRAELTTPEKCVAAALMIGGHEVAGGFAVVFLATEAEASERRAWLGVLAFLCAVYIGGYMLSAGSGLARDIDSATRPFAGHPMSAWRLDVAYPGRCLLGVAAAFKLMWLLIAVAVRQGGRARLHAACAVMAVPLVLVAADTSRIVQFTSLSMFGVVAAVWPGLPSAARRGMTMGLLLLPSICAGTKAMPAWGKGLYAIYLFAAQRAGYSLGGMAFPS